MMVLTSDGIDRVRAFALAGGFDGAGESVEDPFFVLVTWRSEYIDRLHQVYVNGELAGSTSDFSQRMLVVGLPSSWSSAMRIEVFAVEAYEGHVDFGGELEVGGQTGRVEVGWLRRMGLPLGGAAEVYSGGVKVSQEALGLWCAWQDKGGFGLCEFGAGGFGYDGSAAVGFGEGLFGGGEFGFDGDEMVWVSDALGTDEYMFEVKVTDTAGNCDTGVESEEVLVVRRPLGVERITVESYNKASERLKIRIG